ncbi:MAG: hypothetical protein M3Y27_25975 [Acidobacteriota bacterium]|nr:hypothetical protein [Acidobacteriota bacterium]
MARTSAFFFNVGRVILTTVGMALLDVAALGALDWIGKSSKTPMSWRTPTLKSAASDSTSIWTESCST